MPFFCLMISSLWKKTMQRSNQNLKIHAPSFLIGKVCIASTSVNLIFLLIHQFLQPIHFLSHQKRIAFTSFSSFYFFFTTFIQYLSFCSSTFAYCLFSSKKVPLPTSNSTSRTLVSINCVCTSLKM